MGVYKHTEQMLSPLANWPWDSRKINLNIGGSFIWDGIRLKDGANIFWGYFSKLRFRVWRVGHKVDSCRFLPDVLPHDQTW